VVIAQPHTWNEKLIRDERNREEWVREKKQRKEMRNTQDESLKMRVLMFLSSYCVMMMHT